jgi:hypothetical protein
MNPKMAPQRDAPKVQPIFNPTYKLLAATTHPRREPTMAARLLFIREKEIMMMMMVFELIGLDIKICATL